MPSQSDNLQHHSLSEETSWALVANLPSWIDHLSIREIPNPFAKSKQLFLARTSAKESVVIAKFEASTRRYENEKSCLLAHDGRAAPRLLHFDDDNCVLIMEYILGARLSDLDPETDLVARCFAIYASCTTLESNKPHIRHLELLGRLHPLVLAMLSSSERRNLPRLMNLLSSATQIPCHRDFHPRNIMVSERGDIFLIDFESYGNDNPAIDVARMCFNSSFAFSFHTRLGLTAKFRDCLRRKSGFGFQDVELVAGIYFAALTDANISVVRREREISVATKAPGSVPLAAARALAAHTNCVLQ